MKIEELKQKRAKVVADQRALLDKAEEEGRELNTEERAAYENLDKEFQDLGDQIKEAEERAAEDAQRRADLEAREAEMRSLERQPQRPQPSSQQRQGQDEERAQKHHAAFQRLLRAEDAVGAQQAAHEMRALQADDAEAGGYLVLPQAFINQLIKDVDNSTYMMNLATVHQVNNAQSLGAPSLDADPADADWTSELAIGSEDSAMDFGHRELNPHPLGKLLKVSRKLLRLSAVGVEELVRNRLAYKFAVTFENAALNGSGSGQPLGVFVASNDGISTSRDVSTGNSTTDIGADGLIEALYALKKGWRVNATWLFHRDGVKRIRKLKDGDGQYIWQPGLQAGEPDLILGRPVYDSEYAPNTFTTGQYVGIVGDFKAYWFAIALNMAIQRLDELYAATNQVGFIGRMEADGMPVQENAFSRVKLA